MSNQQATFTQRILFLIQFRTGLLRNPMKTAETSSKNRSFLCQLSRKMQEHVPLARKEDAEKLAQRYVGILRRPFNIAALTIEIDTSNGISRFPDDADNAIDLFRRAALKPSEHGRGEQIIRK